MTPAGPRPTYDPPIAFERSTIGDVLDRMQQKGWIRRTGSRGDRRIKLIELTDEGARLLRQVEPAIRWVQERILDPLAPAGRASFIRLLARLADLHNEVTPAPVRSIGA